MQISVGPKFILPENASTVIFYNVNQLRSDGSVSPVYQVSNVSD